MGIFDEVQKIGGSLLGENHAGALSAITDYINSPQVGGISGLQKMFQEKGLGGIVGSWIGTGQNLPISADQLNSVLHCDALNQVASKFGIDPNMLQSAMTQILPHVVDQMTPNGQIASAAGAGQ
ncbi:MAG TPA: YidB family protein [Candidatus Acidoferrum sp.]|jgi:uncharacterized protein YidB (DUF937 family)|nr:YidB family protein [Candidatus Acidoferrum sp.]